MPEEMKKKFRKSIEAKSLSHDVNILSNKNKQLFVKKKKNKDNKKKLTTSLAGEYSEHSRHSAAIHRTGRFSLSPRQ